MPYTAFSQPRSLLVIACVGSGGFTRGLRLNAPEKYSHYATMHLQRPRRSCGRAHLRCTEAQAARAWMRQALSAGNRPMVKDQRSRHQPSHPARCVSHCTPACRRREL